MESPYSRYQECCRLNCAVHMEDKARQLHARQAVKEARSMKMPAISSSQEEEKAAASSSSSTAREKSQRKRLQMDWTQPFKGTATAMIDSGSSINLITPQTVNDWKIPWVLKKRPYRVYTFGGKSPSYEQEQVLRETVPMKVVINGDEQEIVFDITPIGKHDAILGRPWLRKYNPDIDWKSGKLKEYQMLPPARQPLKKSHKNDQLKDVPVQYRGYNIFRSSSECTLPEHGPWDHEIPLKEGTKPKSHKIYQLNEAQIKALREYIDERLKLGHIRESQSPWGSPVLFVPKKDGELRLVVDYRYLNNETVKNRYPLPLIQEMRDRLGKAKIFSKFDLTLAFSQIRMKKGEELKTAFRTPLGHYEYRVIPQGLTNAPASFQARIDAVLRQFAGEFVMAYIDDIIVFSENEEEHEKHVHKVLAALEKAGLSMDPAKVKDIAEWPAPTSVTGVRGFLGFINFYRRFIKGFGGIAKPLNDLTKKDVPFVWSKGCDEAFNTLKELMLKHPILKLPDPDKPFEVETDASDWAMGGQLGQRDEQGRLHPVAFFSKAFRGPELNYPIHDKELMSIIWAFKEWKPWLSGTEDPVLVYSDHKNLTWFTTSKELNQRQTRWSEFLSQFNFTILYRKGSENARADALSRREDLKESKQSTSSPALFQANEDGSLRHVPPADIDLNMEDDLKVYVVTKGEPDDWIERIMDAQHEADDEEIKKHFATSIEPWMHNGKLWVPPRLRKELVRDVHESPEEGGHAGIARTIARLQETFGFAKMKDVVTKVLHECEVCHKTKANRHKPYGLLEPLPVAEGPWQCVTMDFITKLPVSRDPATGIEYDSILVVVDRFTKFAYFLPFREDTGAEQLGHIFIRHITSNHGWPKELVTDRDKLFSSRFWKAFMNKLGVKHKMSTAYHARTDGQTERMNQVLEAYLRAYVNYEQDNWSELLPTAQMSYNSSKTETTKVTPFFANFGYEMSSRRGWDAEFFVPRAHIRAERLIEMHQTLRDELTFVRDRMSRYYDRTRSTAPIFKRGDKVYLLHRNIKTKRPSDKLDYKKLGPFKVLEKVSTSNYRLELPKSMRQWPTIHISLLEPAPKNARLDKKVETWNEGDEFMAEGILDSMIENGNIKYFVKWKGYGHESNTWEPPEYLLNFKKEIEDWHRQNPDRPKPPTAPRPQETSIPALSTNRQSPPRRRPRR
ncbi:hypothetical protein SMACR_01061 [Sordaria macrospora]|uniref:RNA-directed DNA polymerase n=1 Tax=Sordaria macrospora TaxID=5147 RepID=A0A8S8ZW05_SORMA|nr:hypothetical protein SMACR_01061 [Sordaria macrospora]